MRRRWLGAGPFYWSSLSSPSLWLVRRERVDAPGAGILAAVVLLISAAMLIRAAVRTGSFLNGYTLVLGTFLLTYPLSAFVHLTGASYISLGFYEIAALDRPHNSIMCIYR